VALILVLLAAGLGALCAVRWFTRNA
jgi:hypothetical protein